MPPLPPLVVVDFRVFVYDILHKFQTISENRDQRTQKNWLKAAWAIYLNRGTTALPYVPHTVVICNDSPPYWRNKYLLDRGFPEYKAGRPSKPDTWYQVAQEGKDYIFSKKSPFLYLEKKGFEADDLAGAIARTSPKRTIILHTIDTDWLGLVKESGDQSVEEHLYHPQKETQVLWANLAQWMPRLRGESEAIEYTQRRLKSVINSPRGIWDVKVEKGDKADNLVPGSPLEVIDLEAPPPEFDLLQNSDTKQEIEETANARIKNSHFDHLIKGKEWFVKNGFPIPMLDFNIFPVKR